MRILLAVGRDPWPARRGDQLRATQLVEALAVSHEVTVLAPGPWIPALEARRAPARVERYRPTLPGRALGILKAAFRGHPLQAGLFSSGDLNRRLLELAAETDLVIVQLARLERAVRKLTATVPTLPVLVDLIDALSLGASSRAEVDRADRRVLLRREAERLATLERRLVERSAGATVVAARDREAIAGDSETLRRKLSIVPLALEPQAPIPAPRSGPPTVVLTGNLGYFVNRDAVLWTLHHVWPALRARRPDLELQVAGARPDAGLRRAVARAGVTLLADPPSLDDVLARATVSLAPMRCGSGTPIKVLEAWAAGVPVVASPYAAAGTQGVGGRDLLLAREPEDWVLAVLRLLDDREERARLIAGGQRTLEREYSPSTVLGAIESALAAAVEARRPRGAGVAAPLPRAPSTPARAREERA